MSKSYNALVNLRFNKNIGPVDLTKNVWSSKVESEDYDIDLVDYSPLGVFNGNAASFNGEDSVIYKMSGSNVILDDFFTISFWVNFDHTESTEKQFIISDGNVASSFNKLYFKTSGTTTKLYLVTAGGEILSSNNIYDKISANNWNHVCIVNNADGLRMFLNGVLVNTLVEHFYAAINFDTIRATIGCGYDVDTGSDIYFKGLIDDFVIINDAIELLDDTVDIPTEYLMTMLDPTLDEDTVGWEDIEPEYSRKDHIIHLTEWKRMNTRKITEEIQNGLIPYRIPIEWKQSEEMFFKNGSMHTERDRRSLKIKLYNFPNNWLFKDNAPRFIDEYLNTGFKRNIFIPFILFVDDKFIPWSNIRIVKSDQYITLLVYKVYRYHHIIENVQIISLPFDVYYSEKSIMPSIIYKPKVSMLKGAGKKYYIDNNKLPSKIISIKRVYTDDIEFSIGDYTILNSREIEFNDDVDVSGLIYADIEAYYDGTKIFGFDKEYKIGGDDYIICSLEPTLHVMKYEEAFKWSHQYINIDMKTKITNKNVFIFDHDSGGYEDKIVYKPKVLMIKNTNKKYSINTDTLPSDIISIKNVYTNNIKYTLDDYDIINSKEIEFKDGVNVSGSVYADIQIFYIDYQMEIGNKLTITDPKSNNPKKHDVYIFWDSVHAKSEDNASKVPNVELTKSLLLLNKPTDIDDLIDLDALKREFQFVPTYNKREDDKYYNSIGYIFNYNRNKYDPIYEYRRPMNDIEYTGSFINSKKNSSGNVTMSRDIYDRLDIKNDAYPIIFHNGILPTYYKNITYKNDTFTFKPGTVKDDDFFEICYFRNILNRVFPVYREKYPYAKIILDNQEIVHRENQEPVYIRLDLPELKITNDGILYNMDLSEDRYYYIPKDDLLIFTDKLGSNNLCPVIYTIDEVNNRIEIDPKYGNTNLFFGSVRQFLYQRIPLYEATSQSIPIPYAFRTGYNPDNYHVFLNGKLIDRSYYRVVVPTLTDGRVKNKTLYFVKPIKNTDRLDLFYIGGTASYMNASGNLVVKSFKVKATDTNQKRFLVPLPYGNYPIDYDTFMVIKHSLRMSTDKYKIYQTTKTVENMVYNPTTETNEPEEKEVVISYIELVDQDDYLIPGEELVFIFPYYKSELETINEPTDENTLQFITRYKKITSETNTVVFDTDFLGNVNDSRYIYIFKDTELVPRNNYNLSDVNTITFKDPIPANSEVCMVIETDRYNIKNNNIQLHFVDIPVVTYGQISLDLPYSDNKDAFIFFKNNKIIDSETYDIIGNKLVFGREDNDLVAGEIITAVYATDNLDNSNNISFKSYTIKAVADNKIDIPNFNNIRYNESNILVFVDNKFIPNNKFTVAGNTINFNNGILLTNDVANVYTAYKTVNTDRVSYNLSNTESIKFTEVQVTAYMDNQTEIDIPYPTRISTYFNDYSFILFIRGEFIPDTDYTISNDRSSITIKNTYQKLLEGDEITFVFCHNYNLASISKKEYTTTLLSGQTDVQLPTVYTRSIDLMNKVMVFYGGTFIDQSRYTIDKNTRVLKLTNLPYDNELKRKITIVFFYTSNTETGSIGLIPQSGYISFNEHYIDRNLNREMYMIFINGKKVTKSNIIDVTNSIKKIGVDIKSRYGLSIWNCSPLITEFKEFYDNDLYAERFIVTIENTSNQSICVTCNGIEYYSTFDAKYGDYFTVRTIPDYGYIGGDVYIDNNTEPSTYGNVFSDITISAIAPTKGTFRTVTINQKDNQYIKVKCNGIEYTTTFREIEGSPIEISLVEIRDGYKPGTLTIDGVTTIFNNGVYTGTIGNSNITINVSKATILDIPFRVLDENMFAQTIKVEFIDNNNQVYETYTTPGTSTTIPFGTRMRFLLESTDNLYMHGNTVGPFKVNKYYMADYKYPLNDLIPDSVHKIQKYLVKINQSPNQMLYVDTYPDIKDVETSINKIRHVKDFYVGNNEYYMVGVEANYGYTPGMINVSTDRMSGVASGPIEVSVTDAIVDTVVLTINIERLATGSITVNLDNGQSLSKGGYIIQRGSTCELKININGVVSTQTYVADEDTTVILRNDNSISIITA